MNQEVEEEKLKLKKEIKTEKLLKANTNTHSLLCI